MSIRENGSGRTSRFGRARAPVRPPPEPLYLPPHKVASLELSAVSREERQRLSWERLRKRIHGVVNRVNAGNAAECVVDLLRLNLVRGTGLLARSLLRAQVVSQNFTPVYAAVVAAVNARIPEVGELLIARLFRQLSRGMDEKDRGICVASVKLLAHLFNQSVVDALVPLEIMNVLASAPSNDSIELLVVFIKECGVLLQESEPRMLDDLFQLLRTVVQEGEVSQRIQFLVEGLMALRRTSFATGEPIPKGLDLVPDEDRVIHNASFGEPLDPQLDLDGFVFSEDWEEAEIRYAEFRVQVLGEDDDLLFEEAVLEDGEGENYRGGGAAVADPEEDGGTGTPALRQTNARKVDLTEEDLVTFRRKVYLRIMSAASYEECAHKLVQFMRDFRGHEGELCNMVIECCSQERTFMRYYGLIGLQLCRLDRVYVAQFEEAFAVHYSTIHQYDSRKIRNMANFYSFLLCGDGLPWSIFGVVVLSEEETTSSSRIFLKYLLPEIAHTLTVGELNKRMQSEELRPYVTGLLPSEVPANIRFAINFFTAIGLGPLTDGMRARLREIPNQKKPAATAEADNVSSSSSSSLSSSSDSSSSLSPSSEDGSRRGSEWKDYDSDGDRYGRRRKDWSGEADRNRASDDEFGRKRVQAPRDVSASPRPRKYPRTDRDSENRELAGSPGRRRLFDRPDSDRQQGADDRFRERGRGRGRGRRRDAWDGPPPAALGRGRGRGGALTIPAWVKERANRPPENPVQDRSPSPSGRSPVRHDVRRAERGPPSGRSLSPAYRGRRRRSLSRSPPRYRDRSPPRRPSRSPVRRRDLSRDDRFRDRSLSPGSVSRSPRAGRESSDRFESRRRVEYRNDRENARHRARRGRSVSSAEISDGDVETRRHDRSDFRRNSSYRSDRDHRR